MGMARIARGGIGGLDGTDRDILAHHLRVGDVIEATTKGAAKTGSLKQSKQL